MTGQWSDRSAMSGRKTFSPPGPMSYLCGLALRIWTSFWRSEDFDGMDMWNAPVVQSRQPLTYRLMESVGLGGPKWHGSSWQRGTAESGSSRLSTLMIDVPGDLVWDLPCVQQASYLEGGPLVWMLPLYLHVNQKSNYMMIIFFPRKSLWQFMLKMKYRLLTYCAQMFVNVPLKLWLLNMAYTIIFFAEKCEYKNTSEFDIVLTRTVNILTTDELVKITMLWTPGPRILGDWLHLIDFSADFTKILQLRHLLRLPVCFHIHRFPSEKGFIL